MFFFGFVLGLAVPILVGAGVIWLLAILPPQENDGPSAIRSIEHRTVSELLRAEQMARTASGRSS